MDKSFKIRNKVFDTYWYFAFQRQEIFYKRLSQEPQPWTSDPILSEFKFCNAYRASDRVSQYLIGKVIYSKKFSEPDTIFRILLFKLFNKIETWQGLEQQFGEISLANFNSGQYGDYLEKQIQNGCKIYSNAYISCANKAFGFDRKHLNHLALIHQMFNQDHLPAKIVAAPNFKTVFELLRSYPLIGSFMAYQLATDLNYSEVINFSENQFTVAGPGSQRGIEKCFEDLGGKSSEYFIRYMQEQQEQEFSRLGLKFRNLFGRPLQLIDCQNLFCETDKYCRAAYPQLKSNRSRIKTKFTPASKPLIPFYPPKWGLDTSSYL